MREKLELGAGAVAVVVLVALAGYATYAFGSLLIDIFGVFHALLVFGGLVILCAVGDLVAPRRDGRSWFGVLFDVALACGDDDDE